MAAAPTWNARISDELLVYGLCNGEREAFERLFERFFDRIYEIVGRSLKDRSETERMVSRVFIKAFDRIGSYRGESPLPAWFFGFVRRALSEYHANRASQRASAEAANRSMPRPLLSGAGFQPEHDWMSGCVRPGEGQPQLVLCEYLLAERLTGERWLQLEQHQF